MKTLQSKKQKNTEKTNKVHGQPTQETSNEFVSLEMNPFTSGASSPESPFLGIQKTANPFVSNQASPYLFETNNAIKENPFQEQKLEKSGVSNAENFTYSVGTHQPIQQKKNDQPIQKQDLGMTVSNQVSDAQYGWTSSYSLQIIGNECFVTINLKINPDADVTPAQVGQVWSVTSNEFARYFDSRFNLVDSAGQRLPLRVRLNQVDSGEHLAIALHAGEGHDNLSNWFVNSSPIDRAHELGHQLGLKDEYIDATVPNRSTALSPGVSHDDSIMGNYYTDGIRDADVRARHGDQLASDISAATGRSFTAEFSDTYIVHSGDNLSWIAQRMYGDQNRAKDIYDLNRDIIADPNLIYPGQELKLPPR